MNRSQRIAIWVLTLIGLLAAWKLFGQGFGGFRSDQPFLARNYTAGTTIQNPTNLGQMFRWYVASDVATNVVVSNQWSDRIASQPLHQMNLTQSPTNSALGVRFNGNQFLTNEAVGAAYSVGNIGGMGSNTFFCIIKPDMGVGNHQVLSDATYGVAFDNGNLTYLGSISGGPNIICPLASVVVDIATVFYPKYTLWYTNGILAKSNSTASVDTWFFDRAGRGTMGYYQGYIQEIGIYTNVVLDSTGVATLHKYATNTYNYSP